MQDVLVVVDMQNDFINGALGTKEAEEIVPKVAQKIRDFSGRVLFTRDTHGEQYLITREGHNLPIAHCVRNTPGWQIHPILEELRKETPIDKETFGSVGLGSILRAANHENPIQSITLIGVCTDICVISNAMLLQAFLPETEIIVDASCCAGVTPERHKVALDAMKACQIRVVSE